MQALALLGHEAEAAFLVAPDREAQAGLDAPQDAHQAFLDAVSPRDGLGDVLLGLPALGDELERPPVRFGHGFRMLLQPLRKTFRKGAEVLVSHAHGPQEPVEAISIADRTKRPTKQDPVKAAQNARDTLRLTLYKALHGVAPLGPVVDEELYPSGLPSTRLSPRR
jgi:hypothetical protein